MSSRLALALLACACSPVNLRGTEGGLVIPDGGSAPSDAGPVRDDLVVSVDYGSDACGELSVAHAAPEHLMRISVTGPPDTRVEIWAARARCGAAPFFFREVMLDGEGRGATTLESDGTATCTDSVLGPWEVWAVADGGRSEAVSVRFAHAACGIDCAAAETFCPVPPDAGVADAGLDASAPADAGFDASVAPDAGLDAGTPADAGSVGPVSLLAQPGCFFTPGAAERFREYRVGERGTIYDRVDVRFDVVAGPWLPHIPDPSNRTEHILFGFSRAFQPRSFQRYLLGVAAVDFVGRTSHFRMFGREAIADGFMSYTQVSASYAWSEGTRYTVECSLDAVTHLQRCTLATGGAIVATRDLPVAYLDAAMHLGTAFDLILGDAGPVDHDHLQSPLGWAFCELEVVGHPR